MVSEYIPQLIKQSANIAIFLNDLNDIDKVVSVISLALMIKSDGKTAEIIIPEDVTGEYMSKFQDYHLEVKHKVLPQRYVVRIDYGNSPLEKITYEPDEKTGKLNFYITPKDGEFSFDNVEYAKEGVGYDALIFVGMKDPKELGDLYDNNKEIFDSSKIIAFSKSGSFPADNVVELKKNNSYSEAVYHTVLMFSTKENFDPEIASLLLLGVLSNSGLLEGFSTTDDQVLIGNLSALGGNLNNGLKQIYFSKDNANTLLQLKLAEKVKTDFTNGLSYSVVSQADLKHIGINSEQDIDVKGRLPNNIGELVLFACVAYEVEPEKLWVVIQADGEKYSASNFAQVFEGAGNDKSASCMILNTSVEEFEKVLYTVFKDLYGIKKESDKPKKSESKSKNTVIIEEEKTTKGFEDTSAKYPY
jgi:nanoRNase/pAp phosphatase (c-di-AMP/oligoRNAs hydrolase)